MWIKYPIKSYNPTVESYQVSVIQIRILAEMVKNL